MDERKSRVASYRPGNGAAPDAHAADVFLEVVEPQPTLIIVGAGHIAVPLAQMGKMLSFEVIVLDDREKFANRERFPDSDQVIADDFGPALSSLKITRATYIVIITRGHQYDEEALMEVAESPAAYIGMIGSKRRVWTVLKLLHDEGVPPEKLLRIYAPIGIDIEAVTPAEIAVAIGAELVKLRRGGTAASLSDAPRDLFRKRLERMGTLAG
jgi:xanthine dehydrogenase accessory factor